MKFLSDADIGLGSTPMPQSESSADKSDTKSQFSSDADVGIGEQTQASGKGFWQSAVEGARNIEGGLLSQQQAASQRTTGVLQAQEKNYLGPATGDELGNVGYKDINGQFVPTDKNKHVALFDPADQTTKVYARTPETDVGVAESAGRMAGTIFQPQRIITGGVVAPAIQSAERLAVDVPRAVVSESPNIRFAGQVAAKGPGGAPMYSGIQRGVEQLGERVGETARTTGTVGPLEAGERVSGAVDEAFRPGGSITSQVDKAYERIGQLVDPNRTQSLNATAQVANTINAERAAGAVGPSQAVKLIEDGATRPGGLTYQGIQRLRNNVGRLIERGALADEGYDGAELKRLYGALSDDLRVAVIDAGGPRAASAFERANQIASGVADWKETLRKVIGSDSRSDESVFRTIVNMASTGASADARTLAAARAAVPPEVWQDVAATAISQLGKKGDVWTAANFLSDYGKLSPDGRRLLFGSVGNGQIIPFLNDIAEVSDRFVQAGKMANTSGSAGHAAAYAAFTALIGGIAGIGTALLGGGMASLAAPALALGAVFGNNMMARVLATPATAASMARWARVYTAVAERPTPQGIAAFQRVSGELANTVNGTLGTKVSPTDIMRSTVQAPGTSQAGTNQENIPRPVGQ